MTTYWRPKSEMMALQLLGWDNRMRIWGDTMEERPTERARLAGGAWHDGPSSCPCSARKPVTCSKNDATSSWFHSTIFCPKKKVSKLINWENIISYLSEQSEWRLFLKLSVHLLTSKYRVAQMDYHCLNSHELSAHLSGGRGWKCRETCSAYKTECIFVPLHYHDKPVTTERAKSYELYLYHWSSTFCAWIINFNLFYITSVKL